jgi:hypothetical protein
MARFTDRDYQLTGNLTEVPGIDKTALELLRNEGVVSTYQLLGRFLSCDRDLAEFESTLAGCPEAATICNAVRTRVATASVKIVAKLPDVIDGRPVSSRVDDVKAQNICKRKFNNDIRHDFEGCGLGKPGDKTLSQGMQSLQAHGITSTNKLYGEMLMCFSGPPTQEMMVAFRERLGDLGVSSGYKTTMMDAMRQKLDIGLDNSAKPPQQAIPEEGEKTGEKAGRKPSYKGSRPPFAGFDTPEPAEPAKPQEPPASFPFLKITLAMVLLGIAAAALFPPPSLLALGGAAQEAIAEPEGQWL